MKYKNPILANAIVLLLMTIGAEVVVAQQYAIRSIDAPGAAATEVTDTNNHGQVVGCFTTTDLYNGPGFVLANGAFKLVKYPKAVSTCVYGESNDGKIAGIYVDNNNNLHGFLRVAKTYKTIDYPGAVFTEALKVNNAGVVVGLYYDGSTGHGFMWQSGAFTTIDYPGASSTDANGINDSGVIVGSYNTGTLHGFLLSSGSYTSINYPGAAGSGATGINNAGQIVGSYYNTPYVDQGFLYSNGVFSTIDYPGADVTGLTGINDSGQVVGLWGGPSAVEDLDTHGFVATPIPGTQQARRGNGMTGKGLPHK